MANNQYVNKVIFGNDTLIDLTSDTVSPSGLLQGLVAHDKSGATINGTLQIKSPNIGFNNGRLEVNLTYGVYGGTVQFSTIKIPVPSSGTNSITISVPNGTTTPNTSNADDWIPITFTVDTEGNSELTDGTQGAAEAVSW